MRGSDIPYNPVFYSYVIVTRQPDKLHFVTRSELFEENLESHFNQEGISDQLVLHPYSKILEVIPEIVSIIFCKHTHFFSYDTFVYFVHLGKFINGWKKRRR